MMLFHLLFLLLLLVEVVLLLLLLLEVVLDQLLPSPSYFRSAPRQETPLRWTTIFPPSCPAAVSPGVPRKSPINNTP